MSYKGIIEKFREFLPITDKTPIVSLLEGNTPLIKSAHLSNMIGGGSEVYLK